MAPVDRDRTIRDPTRLATLRRLHLLDSPAEDVFDRLTSFATRRLKVPIALINLIDAERQFFKSAVGMGDLRELPIAVGVCSHTLDAGEPLVLEDARVRPEFASNPIVAEHGLVAYIGVPLETSEGHRVGTFCVADTVPRDWSRRDLETVRSLAGAAITEIELRLDALEQERQLYGLVATYSRAPVPTTTAELGRLVGWNVHACLSIIEDLEVAAEWSRGRGMGELVRSLVSSLFTLSHLLWPGGRRGTDQGVADLAAAARPALGIDVDDSVLHWRHLEPLSRLLGANAEECADCFDPETYLVTLEDVAYDLGPAIEAIRRLWAAIAHRVDSKAPA